MAAVDVLKLSARYSLVGHDWKYSGLARLCVHLIGDGTCSPKTDMRGVRILSVTWAYEVGTFEREADEPVCGTREGLSQLMA